MKTKFVALLVIICICILSFGAVPVFAATHGDLTYEIANGEVTITDCDESATNVVILPKTINGYPVTTIDDYAFYNCSSLTSVTIPDGVTSIGGSAFSGCVNLTRVTIQDHTTEQFNLAMYSGLYATFYYMKACYPYLKETQGSVINFASGAGLFGNYGQSSYAAAKEAIRGFSRVAATEWAKDGINTNVVCPLAWTAQLENFEKAYPDAFKANVKMPPAGHYGDSELEIGRVCVQLASPDFKYMNGETLTLEGGMGLRP